MSVLLAAFVAAAGCSSSSPGPSRSLLPPSSAQTSPPAPVPVPSTPSPPVSPSSSAEPLSPYENDPAVRVLRAWAAETARTINTGHYDNAALKALMTPALAKAKKNLAGGEVGCHYPGPLPFTPIR